jgi:hypothetical protein
MKQILYWAINLFVLKIIYSDDQLKGMIKTPDCSRDQCRVRLP